ncbi:MAG: sensor histidine kinase [Campylobacterales bacterium]|nr:sensor histidine kinase [Campylobacterales bacterium]
MLLFGALQAGAVLSDSSLKLCDFSVKYLYDETSQMGISEAASSPFPQTIPPQFALGYKEGAAWFRLTLKNRSGDADFVLHFTEPFWNTFDLYEPGDKGWTRRPNGLHTPLTQRQIQHASPAFRLSVPPGSTKIFYVRGQTANAQIGAFELYTAEEYFKPSRFDLDTFYLFYLGILFIIAVLNLFLLIEMRERIYAYYIGYVVSFILFITMFNAFYLYAGLAPWPQGLHAVGTVVMAFMALFSAEFLELKKYFPRMALLIRLFIWAFLLFGILIHLQVPHITPVFNILSSLLVGILVFLAVKTWIAGNIKTPYYLIALIIYMPAMGLMVLTFDGLLPNNDLTRYGFLLGALIEIIFFSLILASRFHAAKNEMIALQKALLDEKEKSQAFLEAEIDRQRQEIQEKNAILFNQSRHAAMGEMISMIAHQWRQPLNTLALINENLYFQHKFGEWNEESFERSHDQFNEHLQYMSKTIDDFRNYYKNDKTKRYESIGEIVSSALRLSDVFLKYAKIKTDITVSTDERGYFSKNEMIQVLMNLIKNSHDAIVERRIPSGKITISVEERGTSICILVCDNAGGISDEIAAKIFEPYFSTKSDNGTGLGLYMSKSIIEEHCNGSLTHHNTDEGACFTVLIPIHHENTTPDASQSSNVSPV